MAFRRGGSGCSFAFSIATMSWLLNGGLFRVSGLVGGGLLRVSGLLVSGVHCSNFLLKSVSNRFVFRGNHLVLHVGNHVVNWALSLEVLESHDGDVAGEVVHSGDVSCEISNGDVSSEVAEG